MSNMQCKSAKTGFCTVRMASHLKTAEEGFRKELSTCKIKTTEKDSTMCDVSNGMDRNVQSHLQCKNRKIIMSQGKPHVNVKIEESDLLKL